MSAVGVPTGGREAWSSGGVIGRGGRRWSRMETAIQAIKGSGEGGYGLRRIWIGDGVAIGWQGDPGEGELARDRAEERSSSPATRGSPGGNTRGGEGLGGEGGGVLLGGGRGLSFIGPRGCGGTGGYGEVAGEVSQWQRGDDGDGVVGVAPGPSWMTGKAGLRIGTVGAGY